MKRLILLFMLAVSIGILAVSCQAPQTQAPKTQEPQAQVQEPAVTCDRQCLVDLMKSAGLKIDSYPCVFP